MAQTIFALATSMEPVARTISFPEFHAKVRANADLGGIKNGPRVESNVEDQLGACTRRDLISVDFECKTLQITPYGRLELDDVLDVQADGVDAMPACYDVIKLKFARMISLSKADLRKAHARRERQERERKLEYVRKHSIELAPIRIPSAGPSKFTNGTPLRKSSSMGVWASPVSLPRRRTPYPRFIPPSPTSPTPRTSANLEIDDRETDWEFSSPPPSVEPPQDVLEELREIKKKLAAAETELAAYKQETQRLTDQVEKHQAERKALQGENSARVEELKTEIAELKTRILDMDQKMEDTRAAVREELLLHAQRLMESF